MPSGNLKGRLTRLEHTLNAGASNQTGRRAYLAAYFADARYDAHREALIDALCSPTPSYDCRIPTELSGRPATEHHFISWHGRDEGEPVVHIFIMPDREDDPNRPAK